MPVFLIPIAIGAYMYYEKQRKEAETENKESPNNECESINEMAASTNDDQKTASAALSSDKHGCEEQVIETQLTQEAGPETISIHQQVEVTFYNQGVPDRRESEVSDDGCNETPSEQQSRILYASSDIEMVVINQKRSLQGTLGVIRKLLPDNEGGGSGVREDEIRVLTRKDDLTCIIKRDQDIPLPKVFLQ